MTNAVNGRNGWIKWLVGALWGILVLAITTIGNGVVANDKESRARDIEITDKVEKKLDEIHKEQTVAQREMDLRFTEVLVAIAELKNTH